jgi:hypothetical protein
VAARLLLLQFFVFFEIETKPFADVDSPSVETNIFKENIFEVF